MSFKTRFLIFAAVSVALPIQSQVIRQRITLPKSDGVVIDLGSGPKVSWTPSREDVLLFENALPRAVVTNEHTRHTRIARELPNYKRQYFGVVRNSRRELRVTLLHNSSNAVRDGSWLRTFLQVMGGGDSYGRVTFDPRTRRITELFPNGPK